MFSRLAVAALCISLGLSQLVFLQSAQAQRFVPRYTSPSRPTLSPYLQYFRQDSGVLPRYYNFIQPREQLQRDKFQSRNNFNRLQTQVSQQQKGLNTLNNQLRETRPTTAAPTGSGSTFMNYSHYFGGGGGGRR